MADAAEVKKVTEDTKKKMTKAVEATRKEFQNLRTGRASIHLVEGIQVDYYNTPTPLKGLANIMTPDPKTIAIQPWDATVIAEIEKAILKSDLGLNPMNDGKIVRIQVPALTEERRSELSKVVRKVAEEGRVSVRSARHEAVDLIKRLEKDGLSEDLSRTAQKDIQKITDTFVAQVDEALKSKEEEIHSV